jgi:replicative DNA helicase
MSAPADRDRQVEQAVLGGCIVKPDLIDTLDLDREAFASTRHRSIWDAMLAVRRDGGKVDELTIASALRKAKLLDDVGGELYIAEVTLRVPTVANVITYAEILREHAITRRVLALAQSVPDRLESGLTGEDLLSDIQRALSEIDARPRELPVTLGEAVVTEWREIFSFLDRAKNGELPGIPTGIASLDDLTGGLPRGSPIVFGARPGEGKSTLALCVARHAASLGIGVHVFTYEDRRPAYAQRQLAAHADVDVSRIRARTLDRSEITAITRAAEELKGMRQVVIEHAHGMPVSYVIRRARGQRRDLRTEMVIVDYLQLIPAPRRGLRRFEIVEENINALAELAGQDDLAVVIVSQLGRESEREGRRPRLSDFRDSGAIEAVGKLIVALHNPPDGQAGELELIVLKNHQGPRMLVHARYDAARCRIS